jgi:hypothetical protein
MEMRLLGLDVVVETVSEDELTGLREEDHKLAGCRNAFRDALLLSDKVGGDQ